MSLVAVKRGGADGCAQPSRAIGPPVNMVRPKIGWIGKIAHRNSHMTPQIIARAEKLATTAKGAKSGHQRVIWRACVIIARVIALNLHIAFQKPCGDSHHAAAAALAFCAGAAVNMRGRAKNRDGQSTTFTSGVWRRYLRGIAPSLRYDRA